MLKKISVMGIVLFMFGLMLGNVSATTYCKDFLEYGNPGGWYNSLKTWDEEIVVSVGSTYEIDVWINDIPFLPKGMIGGGFFLISDPLVCPCIIETIEIYDGVNGPEGPWDPRMTGIIPDAGGPGSYMVTCARWPDPFMPDTDGDIIVGKRRIVCESSGEDDISIFNPG